MLEVNNLVIKFNDNIKNGNVVDDISFKIKAGEIVALVGESGSGKSMTALSIIGLIKKHGKISGEIFMEGKDLLKLSQKERYRSMGKDITMIFQEPMTSLNPVMKIGKQIEEMFILHPQKDNKSNKEKVLEIMEKVDLPNPEEVYEKYPHELSGGMRQRVMIAIATICSPRLLIADEPTTALDVYTQKQIIDLLIKINQEQKISILIISHDLNMVAKLADKILVMNKGKIIEENQTDNILNNPQQEYTKKLIAAMPKGTKKKAKLQEDKLVFGENLCIYYKEGKKKKYVINNLSFHINKGEILGLVGRSGLGKTTISKTILGIHKDYTGILKNNAKKSQMIFQDPYSSLNPAKTIGWILEEPLKIQKNISKAERLKNVYGILEKVGLTKEFYNRKPRELSGGQRQRVSIAYSLISGADFIIADEPVSALDVTIQAQILELILRLQKEYNLTILFISHDRAVVNKICDRIVEIL